MVDQSENPTVNGSLENLYRCSRCQVLKPASAFHNSRDGDYTYCRDCRNAYDRTYYAAAARGKPARDARRRAAIDAAREWINSLKQGVPCTDCGEIFPPFVMHWDHLPGFAKVDAVSSMVGYRTREAILAELAKCELVCANCHVLRTVRRATRSHKN